MANESNGNCLTECDKDEHGEHIVLRFFTIFPLAAIVTSASLVFNSVLCFILTQRLNALRNSLFYVAAINIMDVVFTFVYCATSPMLLACAYFQWDAMSMVVYEHWEVPMLTVAKVIMTSTAYFILFMSVEKQLAIMECKITTCHRRILAVIAVSIGVALQASVSITST